MDYGLDMKKGFTLIELMVSIAILSIGLVLILQGFTNSLNALRISQNNLEATLLAEDKMAEINIIALESKGGLLSGIEGESRLGNIEFRWETVVTPDEEYENLFKVLFSTYWKEGKRKGVLPLNTYLRIPRLVDSQ